MPYGVIKAVPVTPSNKSLITKDQGYQVDLAEDTRRKSLI